MSQYSQFPTSPGAGGSDVNLSNLASPTAINQHLLPVTNVTYNLGSSTLKWLNLFVGTATVYTSLNMSSQKIINVLDPASNQDAATKKYVDDNAVTDLTDYISSDSGITLETPESLTATYTGGINFKTGYADGATNSSGTINVTTGNSDNNVSGQINLTSGNAWLHAGDINVSTGTSGHTTSGDIQIYSGDAHTNSGTVYIFTGAASTGTKGIVNIEYVPTVNGDWSVVPNNVIDALNKLAARVKALEP